MTDQPNCEGDIREYLRMIGDKGRKSVTPKKRAHLERIRAKANAARKAQAEQLRKEKELRGKEGAA